MELTSGGQQLASEIPRFTLGGWGANQEFWGKENGSQD